MLSYAQNFEDVYIQRAFSDIAAGFYIDIGAYDPIVDSVTQYFYDLGWSGINVEPGASYVRFLKTRPRDINLNVAVSSSDGAAKFFYHEGDPGTSTLLSALDKRLVGKVGERIPRIVETMRLDTIIRQYASRTHIHFLKIDIEGLETDVIADADWSIHRPELLIVEVTFPYSNDRRDNALGKILRKADYVEVFFDGINAYFLRKESLHRKDAFRAPVNVLDQVTKYAESAAASNVKSIGDLAVTSVNSNRSEAIAGSLTSSRPASLLSFNQTPPQISRVQYIGRAEKSEKVSSPHAPAPEQGVTAPHDLKWAQWDSRPGRKAKHKAKGDRLERARKPKKASDIKKSQKKAGSPKTRKGDAPSKKQLRREEERAAFDNREFQIEIACLTQQVDSEKAALAEANDLLQQQGVALRASQEEVSATAKEREAALAQVAALTSERDNLSAALSRTQTELESARASHAAEGERLKRQVEIEKTALAEANGLLEERSVALRASHEEVCATAKEREAALAQVAALASERDDLSGALSRTQTELERARASHAAEGERLKQQIEIEKTALAEAKGLLQQQGVALRASQEKVCAAAKERESALAQVAALTSECDDLSAALSRTQSELESARVLYEAVSAKNARLRDKIELLGNENTRFLKEMVDKHVVSLLELANQVYCQNDVIRKQAAELDETRVRIIAFEAEVNSLAAASSSVRAELTASRLDYNYVALERDELNRELAQMRSEQPMLMEAVLAEPRRALVLLTSQVEKMREEISSNKRLVEEARRQVRFEIIDWERKLSVLRTSSGVVWPFIHVRRRSGGVAFSLKRILSGVLATTNRGTEEQTILRSGLFGREFYLRTYRDVADANIDPLRHYMLHGTKEGRRPHRLFDNGGYVRDNPDVEAAKMNPFFHFIRYGLKEGRKPNALSSLSD